MTSADGGAKLIARVVGSSIEELAAAAREVAGETAAVSISGEWAIEILAAGRRGRRLRRLSERPTHAGLGRPFDRTCERPS